MALGNAAGLARMSKGLTRVGADGLRKHHWEPTATAAAAEISAQRTTGVVPTLSGSSQAEPRGSVPMRERRRCTQPQPRSRRKQPLSSFPFPCGGRDPVPRRSGPDGLPDVFRPVESMGKIEVVGHGDRVELTHGYLD